MTVKPIFFFDCDNCLYVNIPPPPHCVILLLDKNQPFIYKLSVEQRFESERLDERKVRVLKRTAIQC